MSLSLPDNAKFTVSRFGLQVLQPLSFDDWAGLAPMFSEVMQCAAFIIGDWLVYGEDHFTSGTAVKRIKRKSYEAAIAATRLELTTLQAYAHVSRRVPPSLRNKQLSWEHHKAVAKLPPQEQQHWLEQAEATDENAPPMSTRRLRKSIAAGRVVKPGEMEVAPADRGIENHIPYVNRLVALWSRMSEKRWLQRATHEQRAALKRDLQPVVNIYQML